MKEIINISKEQLLETFRNASNEQKTVLESLFGKDVFNPADIRERIKTFEDAVRELGEEHPIAKEWLHWQGNCSADLAAYLKLRIITAALNEGWEPQFTIGEYRYYPWFCLYTQEEIDKMTEGEKCRVVGRASHNAHAYGGLVFSYAGSVSAFSSSGSSSRLAFRTKELAEYAGKQFAEIYADFCFKSEVK